MVKILGVDKKQLTELLNHYTASSAEEATEVILLRNEYPYSQVLHALAARVSKDHGLQNQQALLQSAAIYSTDRSVLKQIMQEPVGSNESVRSRPVVSATVVNDSETLETLAVDDDTDYAEAVLNDLKRLNELKHNFESLVDAFEHGIPEVTTASGTAEEKPKRRGRPRKTVAEAKNDPIIEEIQANKQQLVPENLKTKEQIDIIDQFIKAQPSITAKPRSEHVPSGDLTEIKSGEFADNVISETLVEILIRQGKKEKAIEVLKKLIWKFPQKKTYFAAQIEDLKK